jgi:MFS family permease
VLIGFCLPTLVREEQARTTPKAQAVLNPDRAIAHRAAQGMLLAMSALLAFGMAWLAMATGPLTIMVGAVLIGLGFGGYMPGYAILVREMFPASQAGRRIAEIYFFGFVAAGIGSWTSGWLRDATGSYGVPFMVAAGSAGLGVLGLLRLRQRLGSI